MPDFLRIDSITFGNYKSIISCNVHLQPITYLIGTNGSGKSNFLDAVCFIKNIFRYGLPFAIENRGGIQNILNKTNSYTSLYFYITFSPWKVSPQHPHQYSLSIRTDNNDYYIESEFSGYGDANFQRFFSEKEMPGYVNISSITTNDKKQSLASQLMSHSHIYDGYTFIRNATFHNFFPEVIREMQSPNSGDVLAGNGSNLCSVLKRITQTSPDIKKRIDQYLSVVVPSITHVEAIDIGPYETLEFYYDNGQKFYANSMSDGTLRALGILTALLQDSPLVGIEEPETALHPAAAGVLHDAIREASLKKQVIVTSHSPDLLDDPNLDPDSILVTTMENGSTRIAPLGNASREAIKTHLYTAGELLRMDKLQAEPLA
jgi:predicted ATPase